MATATSARWCPKLGSSSVEIVATAKSGDVTTWDRPAWCPRETQSHALGPLVPDGTSVPKPQNGVKLGSTVTLQLQVTSCGKPAVNPGLYADKLW